MAAMPEAPKLGIKAPDFSLPATDGGTYALADIMGPNGAVVVFICNHCPYVKAVTDRMVEDAKTLAAEGIGFAAISANDAIDYPQLEQADLLVTLSQQAATQYIGFLRPEGILIYDSEKVMEPPAFKGTTFAIPFARLALEETGRQQTTNILTLGAVVGITGIVLVGSLRKAVMGRVPAGTEEVNGRAVARGLALDPAEWQNGCS